MRFLSYAAGLIIAALIVLVPAERARAVDLLDITISDGTKAGTYSSGFVPSSGGAFLPTKFTLDGVTFKGGNASVLTVAGGSTVNEVVWGAAISGKESSGTVITITVTDKAFPIEASSFSTQFGFTAPVASTTAYTATSTVAGTTDGPYGNANTSVGGGAPSTPTTVTSPTDPTEITWSGTLTGFKMQGGSPSIGGYTLLYSVPEPNAILIGLLGLPCMGVVVYFARRRSAAMAALVA